MGDKTNISWCDRTHNHWIGCTQKSAGCKFCYAEHSTPSRVLRANGQEAWGPQGVRHLTSEANRKKPYKWNKEQWGECPGCHWRGNIQKTLVRDDQPLVCPQCATYAVNPTRQRVFCSSLSDVFEDHPSIAPQWRYDLFKMIDQTPNLIWLLLTKRPENVIDMICDYAGDIEWLNSGQKNVWLGTTVENQQMANERIPILLDIPAKVRFLSCEPLLGPVELFNVTAWKGAARWWGKKLDIHLVISGGESGTDARRHLTEWEIHLRDQCHFSGIPFFFKQHGDNSDEGDPALHHGGDWLWGKQYHEFPEVQHGIS